MDQRPFSGTTSASQASRVRLWLLRVLCLLPAVAILSCAPPRAGEPVDLLIHGALVVTRDAADSVLEDGAVAVKGGEIVAVGPSAAVRREYRGKKIDDGNGRMLVPGMINTHGHAAMTLFRGLADDMPLKTWLEDFIWPAEAEFMNANSVRLGTDLAIAEMLRSGTTTFNDMYFFMDEVGEAAASAGMRAVISEVVIDFPTSSHQAPEDALQYSEMLAKKWKGHPLITVSIAPHAPYTCSPELLKAARTLADRYGLPIHTHLSETDWEMSEIVGKYGETPVAHMAQLGLLDGPLIAAHAVVLTDADIDILAAHGVGVAHNPQSNMKLGSGVAPVPAMLKAGVTVGLGTDGAASNNDLDMFGEMDAAAKLHTVAAKDPSVMDARTVVAMATRGGAKVLGLSDKIGSIEEGKRADLVLIDLDRPHLTPLYDPYSHIVYAVRGGDVQTVIIDGRIVMENGKLLTIDEAVIMKKARELAAEIRRRFKK